MSNQKQKLAASAEPEGSRSCNWERKEKRKIYKKNYSNENKRKIISSHHELSILVKPVNWPPRVSGAEEFEKLIAGGAGGEIEADEEEKRLKSDIEMN